METPKSWFEFFPLWSGDGVKFVNSSRTGFHSVENFTFLGSKYKYSWECALRFNFSIVIVF